MLDDLFSYIDKSVDEYLEELKRLCSIPSVSAKGDHLEEAAHAVASIMDSIGMRTELHETTGAPVLTSWLDVDAKHTLLFYNHYDVQPAEPFDLWETPPFEPDIRNGRIFARGVADNKGDIVSRIWAIKSFLESDKEIPVNIKFVVEGEEEVSSPHLHEFVEKNKEFLRADGGIWEFGGAGIDGIQDAWLGLKGILYVQLELETLSHDAHSAYACYLPSAPYRLIWALNSLKDKTGKVQIDGFYERVRPLSDKEKQALSEIDLREEDLQEFYGITKFLDDMKGDELKEAYYNAPTCNICGIDSGYTGEGSKTVLPAKAMAKIDFRLVEEMDLGDILGKLRHHLDSEGFNDVKIAWHKGYPAAKTPIDHPFVEIVKKSNKAVFGHELRIQPTSPGSGPLYLFKDLVPMVSIGCSDFDSRAHSPNESMPIDNFVLGTKRLVVIMDEMGRW
ncbi:MAG: M20/M25/M40 family metallo-hydrolase [Candidatus Thorarchaeota archaeon]|nr:MAG: M20/M25/M40 family metallo-hydrolase [Candidatus Thorarchaeota archaeon]